MKGHVSLRFNIVPPKAIEIKANRDEKVKSVVNPNRRVTKGDLSPTFSSIRKTNQGQRRRVNTQYD